MRTATQQASHTQMKLSKDSVYFRDNDALYTWGSKNYMSIYDNDSFCSYRDQNVSHEACSSCVASICLCTSVAFFLKQSINRKLHLSCSHLGCLYYARLMPAAVSPARGCTSQKWHHLIFCVKREGSTSSQSSYQTCLVLDKWLWWARMRWSQVEVC